MNRIGLIAINVLRLAYAAFFIAVALYSGWSLLSGQGNPFISGDGPGPRFQQALLETGFMIPLMLIFYFIGGALMLLRRTTPLGLVLLAPFMTVIVFYHLLLHGSAVWALGWFAATALLFWHFRRAFRPLVSWRS